MVVNDGFKIDRSVSFAVSAADGKAFGGRSDRRSQSGQNSSRSTSEETSRKDLLIQHALLSLLLDESTQGVHELFCAYRPNEVHKLSVVYSNVINVAIFIQLFFSDLISILNELILSSLHHSILWINY